MLDALELDQAWLPRALERPTSRADTRPAFRWPPAPATRPRARSASASIARARCRSCSAPRASCSRRCERFAADAQARVHAFCHAVPGCLARDGRDAFGGGVAALAARRGRTRTSPTTSCSPRRPRGPRASRAPVPALPRRRAHAARRPRRARRVRGPQHPARPRRARARGARGRGLRPARFARPDLRARRRDATLGRVSGGGARSELWLRIVASVLELPLRAGRRRRGRGVRRRDPRRSRRRHLAPTCTTRSPRRSRRASGSSPSPSGCRRTPSSASATALCTRRSERRSDETHAPATVAIFDFDGVIVDSRTPVRAAVNEALAAHGFARRSAAELDRFIGPPVLAAFAELTGEPEGSDTSPRCAATYTASTSACT